MPSQLKPSLYGITGDNSSRSGKDLWGKNQFNSTFPLSLCLYMRDNKIPPVAVVSRRGKIQTNDSVWKMESVIGDAYRNPYYHFEKSFDGYTKFQAKEASADKIDLVISFDDIDEIPLEVKLTVVPDSSTASDSRDKWGPEIVMRPVSSAHAMMKLASSLQERENGSIRKDVVSILKVAYDSISIDSWDNRAEILSQSNYRLLNTALDEALKKTESIQKPFLVQPIWKTEGQSFVLCKRCFDVFVWSDVAVMRLPVDLSKGKEKEITRPGREVVRHVRALYNILQSGSYDYKSIYKGMAFGRQTDKAFAMSGSIVRGYLEHDRLLNPHYERGVLSKLILNDGQLELRPERRFDATVLNHMVKPRAK